MNNYKYDFVLGFDEDLSSINELSDDHVFMVYEDCLNNEYCMSINEDNNFYLLYAMKLMEAYMIINDMEFKPMEMKELRCAKTLMKANTLNELYNKLSVMVHYLVSDEQIKKYEDFMYKHALDEMM